MSISDLFGEPGAAVVHAEIDSVTVEQVAVTIHVVQQHALPVGHVVARIDTNPDPYTSAS